MNDIDNIFQLGSHQRDYAKMLHGEFNLFLIKMYDNQKNMTVLHSKLFSKGAVTKTNIIIILLYIYYIYEYLNRVAQFS